MMECTDSLDEFSKLHTVLCYNLQWFAQDGEGGEKTEPATEKKLKDAREEGKVAKSKELTAAFDLIVLFLVFWCLESGEADILRLILFIFSFKAVVVLEGTKRLEEEK